MKTTFIGSYNKHLVIIFEKVEMQKLCEEGKFKDGVNTLSFEDMVRRLKRDGEFLLMPSGCKLKLKKGVGGKWYGSYIVDGYTQSGSDVCNARHDLFGV